jgi:hypothetical protein
MNLKNFKQFIRVTIWNKNHNFHSMERSLDRTIVSGRRCIFPTTTGV